ISLIGTATGHAAEAEKIVSDMKARIKAVNDKVVANVKPEDYPTVAHIVWTDPFWVSGGNTFEDDMITLAGGKNAFSDVNGWGIVTLEKFLTTDPAILLVDSQNYLSSGDDVLKQYFYTEPRVKTLSAVKNNQVNLFNADLIDRGGPRMAECIERIAAILHPDLFDAPVETKQTASPGFSGFAAIAAAAALAGVILVSRRR
ncbi:MAG: ABC transporter substrate-binding protein, partial [Methanocorpusculum sp.]|nr:ABC transporter substrate-binding protein [Methanocorpusculum sp.]